MKRFTQIAILQSSEETRPAVYALDEKGQLWLCIVEENAKWITVEMPPADEPTENDYEYTRTYTGQLVDVVEPEGEGWEEYSIPVAVEGDTVRYWRRLKEVKEL